MSKFSDTEVYPNSPLVNVACEIRFPGELEVECNRHQFWEEIRDDYPHIFVPNVVADSPPALQHYRFLSISKNRRVSVALNSLAFSDDKYDGHVSFTKEFCRIADIFREKFAKIDRVTRIGWRYINQIPFVREEDSVPIGRLLNVQLLLPNNALESPRALDIRVESNYDDGVAIIRLVTVSKQQEEGPSTETQEAQRTGR